MLQRFGFKHTHTHTQIYIYILHPFKTQTTHPHHAQAVDVVHSLDEKKIYLQTIPKIIILLPNISRPTVQIKPILLPSVSLIFLKMPFFIT
jgi:hypothetical protein